MDRENQYKIAQKRVEAKIGFYIHLGVFVAVNILLIGINLTTTPQVLWFIYPLVGWGIGLLLHLVLAFTHFSSGDWKKRMIKNEIDRLQ